MLRVQSLLFRVIALAIVSLAGFAQTTDQVAKKISDDPVYVNAMDLYKQGKFVDAMPILEKLAAEYPSNMVVRESWAWTIFQYAGTLPDAEQRKKARATARRTAVQAKDLGDNSQLLQLMLEQPEDGGSDPTYSDREDVDEAMKAGEVAFSRGDMDEARKGYLRALLLDPNNYDAALYTGDVYFKQQVYGSAGEWFARAIQIDPNRETAYRYWGDTLAAAGKDDEARTKLIDAIVAEPYNRRSWVGLTNWLNRNKLQLKSVQLKDRSSIAVKDDKSVTVTLDSSLKANDPNGLAWMTYSMGRASWHTEALQKEFPNIPRNRRTMQEEVHALNLAVTVLKEQKNYKEIFGRLDPSLQQLIKIQELGFLEPFVLLNRADNEIAQDYEPYRATNRDTIHRYLDEFVVPKLPAKN